MLSIEDFIIEIYCRTDDSLKEISRGMKLRSRGFPPSLSDSEVITMEIVGEYIGIDTDKGIWEYFRRHWLHFFPDLGCRTTFARQAANLWYWKLKLQRRFAKECGAFDDNIHLVDGFPLPVCHFKRAYFSRIFKGDATYGYCAAKDEKYYGFKGHVMISLSGVISSFTLTAANAEERDALWEMLCGIRGLVIGDKGYISDFLHNELLLYGIDLQTPFRSNMKDDRPPESVRIMTSVRREVETVIGQLCERFNIEKVRARDLWYLTSRTVRKILSHTVAVFINCLYGRKNLQFDGLVDT